MKIEQLIVQHLYNSKQVTLQDIGTFSLSPDLNMSFENDKESAMPDNAVSFEFNKKAKQDDDLIAFIVSQTRKIKPLATSDLESYSILAKQFLNIGKPFPIEGLGVLIKTQDGSYEFKQGDFINARLNAAPALLKEKKDEEISFASPEKEKAGKKWVWALMLVLLLMVSVTVYYFLRNDKKELQPEQTIVIKHDTITIPKDTLLKQVIPVPDTTKAVMKAPADSFTFKIVIKEYANKIAAEKAFTKLTNYGHKLLIYPKDSVIYKIAMPFKSPLSDTTRAKDSLNKFFATRTYVEKLK